MHGEVIFISDERELSSAFSQIFKDDIEHASIIFGNVWLRRSVFYVSRNLSAVSYEYGCDRLLPSLKMLLAFN